MRHRDSKQIGTVKKSLGPMKGRVKSMIDFTRASQFQTTAQLHSSQASKVMLKSLQTRLQQYVNCEFPNVQAGFRKGRGTRDEIDNICWIIKKARELQKTIYSPRELDYKES